MGTLSTHFLNTLMMAEKGNPGAQYNLGLYYLFGKGVAINLEEAAKWFRRAADQGYPQAQDNLGAMYANGDGVERDPAEAFRWICKAADQGHAHAQFNKGQAYYNGTGVNRDTQEALAWFYVAQANGFDATRQIATLEVRNGYKRMLLAKQRAKELNQNEKNGTTGELGAAP